MKTAHVRQHAPSGGEAIAGEKTRVARRRLALYAVAFPAAIAVDFFTPLGVADYLIEITLVCIASVWGQMREVFVVTAIASAITLAGVWTSPDPFLPLWMGLLNRLTAIFVMWTILELARRRLAAGAAQEQADAQVRILQGLVPICSACKAIRNTAGEWQKLETYLSVHSEARLTHSMCPPCASKYMEM